MNLQDVSHIHIPDGDVRMIHDSDNRLLWGAVGYNVLFSGNTFQQSYTGKNLFNNKATPLYKNKASAEALPTGVRITTNTATAGGFCFVVFKICDASDYEGQTITLKTNMTRSSTNPARAYIGLSAADGTDRVIKESLSASGSCSYTIEQDTNRPCVIVALYSTNSATPVLGEYVDYTDLQIEVGSTATSYEPYVGGTPSPNPDYPQSIQTVTGLQTVEVSGKNLLSSVWEPGTYSTADGSKQAFANTYRTAEKVAVQSDTTYIVSRDSAGLAMNYYEYDANGNFLAYTLKSANQAITTSPTTKFITMSRSQNGGLKKMMLESGSTITAYEPYSSNVYEINLGKNLFDKDNANIFNGYISNTSSNQLISSNTARVVYIPCSPNTTYSISKAVIGINNRFCVFTTNEVPASNVVAHILAGMKAGENNATSYTVTTSADAKYLCAYVKAGNATATDTQIYATIQIEVGSATAYAPYFTPIELCKLGTYQDYIYKNGGKWYKHQVIGKVIADGDTVWTKSPYGTNNYSFAKNDVRNIENEVMVISDQTTGVPYNDRTTTGMICYFTTNQIFVRNIDINTAADLITHCASNPMTFYYVLATPTDTVITDTNLIAQLEAIYNLVRRYGYNFVVSVSGNNLPIIIDRTLL